MPDYKIEFIGDTENIDKHNDNIDVYVTFSTGEKFVATFFTLDNIKTIMSRYQKSGECFSGKYFWATNMCIVEEISEIVISESINFMIKNGEFENIFTAVITV